MLSLPRFVNAYEEICRVSIAMVGKLSSVANAWHDLDSYPIHIQNLFQNELRSTI